MDQMLGPTIRTRQIDLAPLKICASGIVAHLSNGTLPKIDNCRAPQMVGSDQSSTCRILNRFHRLLPLLLRNICTASLAKSRIASDCQRGSERSRDDCVHAGSFNPGFDWSDEPANGFEFLDPDEN